MMASINSQDKVAMMKEFFKVDVRIIPSKIAFFLHGLHIGSYVAFLNPFFTSVGLTKFHAGLITGMMYVPSIIAAPIWGYVVDRTGRKRLILLILSAGSCILFFPMPWIARSVYPNNLHNTCYVTNTKTDDTRRFNETDTRFTTNNKCGNGVWEEVILFWTLLAIVTVASIFLLPLPNFVETLVMNVVTSGDTGASIGSQRIFSSIGMALSNFVAGKASDAYNEGGLSPYTASFFVFLPATALLFPIGCLLSSQIKIVNEEEEDTEQDTGQTKSLLKEIVGALLTFDDIFFLITVLVSGFANNIFLHFSYLLVTNVMRRSKTEMTLVMIVATAFSALFFPLTNVTIKKVGGTVPAMALRTLSHFVRLFLMSRDIAYEAIVGAQVIGGFGFALSWCAFMDHVDRISPTSINTTMNAIMMIVFHGLGNFVSNIAGGKLYEDYGGRNLFFGVSLLCLVWTVVILLYLGGSQIKHIYTSRNDENPVSPERNVGNITGIDNVALETIYSDGIPEESVDRQLSHDV